MSKITTYSPAIAAHLTEERLPVLGPGKPQEIQRSPLAGLTVDNAFAPRRVGNRDMAALCLAGLWLHFDFLDEAHVIAQDLETPEGNYWHALMHRREPDPGNSKYWFRRVGSHPILEELSEQAPALGYQFTNPYSFIDFVERVRDTGSPDEMLARRVQYLEWKLLFDFCYAAAIS